MIRFVFYFTTIFMSLLLSNSLQAQGFGKGCLGGSPTCVDTKFNSNNKERTTYLKSGENQIQLKVPTDSLSEMEQESIAGKPFARMDLKSTLVFFQELDLILDSQLLVEHNLNPEYNTVKSGRYPMEVVGNEIVISLTLTKSINK